MRTYMPLQSVRVTAVCDCDKLLCDLGAEAKETTEH